MRKWILSLLLVSCIISILHVNTLGAYTPVIDAGHGGEDGGAVGGGGVIESAINLEIAMRLKSAMLLFGTSPVMIRETDVSIHSPGSSSLRQKKVSDLKNRVSIVNETADAFLISIHQNTFGQSKYRGTHVFFTGEESRPMAEYLQSLCKSMLDPTNNRESKKVDKGVYLFSHITKPGILVECGFLTNSEDIQLLQNPDYQKKLTLAILASYLLHCR